MQTQYSIEDWESITSHFTELFRNLGNIENNESNIRFSSFKTDVNTSININKNGKFDASMPLHGIGGEIEQVIFAGNSIQLIGQSLNYTYRIPPEIVNKRVE
jgi:hypothetical protein